MIIQAIKNEKVNVEINPEDILCEICHSIVGSSPHSETVNIIKGKVYTKELTDPHRGEYGWKCHRDATEREIKVWVATQTLMRELNR